MNTPKDFNSCFFNRLWSLCLSQKLHFHLNKLWQNQKNATNNQQTCFETPYIIFLVKTYTYYIVYLILFKNTFYYINILVNTGYIFRFWTCLLEAHNYAINIQLVLRKKIARLLFPKLHPTMV